MANISKPQLGAATLPFPSAASVEPVWLIAEQITLGGTTRRDIMARKYKYVLKWDYISVSDYSALETEINTLSELIFSYGKWPKSAAGVSVLATLSTRELKVGVGDEHFYSSVSLECTEVNSRI